MTVEQNVEYGLKLRRLGKEENKKRLGEILKVVKIEQYKDRLPDKLSGGQQQRVALARAIVIHPTVLLMDEPLSNLDAKLRIEMRTAIREIQKKVGITTVYVTHDQEEALAISDRIAIMNQGVIQQIAAPRDIYSRPANIFVATFIGHSNLFNGNLSIEGDRHNVVFPGGYKVAMSNLKGSVKNGMFITIAVRPEEFVITDGNRGIKGKIRFSTFLGKYINYEIELDNGETIEVTQDINSNEKVYNIGQEVNLEVNSSKINIFNEDGSESLIDGVKKYEN
jgi:iron(III) transport system ATP-binding protein